VDYVRNLKESPSSLFAPFWSMKPLLFSPAGSTKRSIGWRKWDELKAIVTEKGSNVLFLGKASSTTPGLLSPSEGGGESGEQIGFFAVDFSAFTADEAKSFARQEERFSDLRLSCATLSMEQAAILAQAKSMFEWHLRNGYCGKCGTKTVSPEGAHKRMCTNCNESAYPRTDPAMLVLVVSGDKCLLTHSPRHPSGVYTCVAGFMEPGESIEECVRREVFEEAGVVVGRVTYHSSQPWPFPYSVMIGCVAYATSENIAVDKLELEDAQWFERDQVKIGLDRSLVVSFENPSTEFRLPPPLSLAHQLVKAWVEKSKL